jgi:hypothetical protein
MQNSNINTTSEKLFDRLAGRFDIDKDQNYFSAVDEEFEELFAEVLGRICKCSVYLSRNLEEKEAKVLRLENGETFESRKLLDLGYKKVERVWEE